MAISEIHTSNLMYQKSSLLGLERRLISRKSEEEWKMLSKIDRTRYIGHWFQTE